MQTSPLASLASNDAPPKESQAQEWLKAAAAERRGDLALGLELATRAWSAARELSLYGEQLEAGLLRAHFLLRRGEGRALLDFGAGFLPSVRHQGASAALCELLRSMTLAASELREFELALAYAHEGLAAAKAFGQRTTHCMALNAMGLCFERMGDPWQAERLMLEAASMLGDEASLFEAAATQNNLAKVALGAYLLMQDTDRELECRKALDRALHYAQAARVHALALDDPFVLAIAEGNRARAMLYIGRLDEADALLSEVMALHDRLHSGTRGQDMQCIVSEALLARGRMQEALDHAQNTLRASPELQGLGFDAQRLHRTAYRAAKALGQMALALSHLEECHSANRHHAAAQLSAQARFLASRIEAQAQAGQGQHGLGATPALDNDPVTGLGNREQLAARMPELLRAAERQGKPLTVALIDVDRFKPLRAEFGPMVANQVLEALAEMLRDNTRGADLALRWDTDQFLVILPDTVPDRAFEVCERLRVAVETHDWPALAPGLDVTLSVGLAHPPPHATDVLIARARTAMQRAKHLGRNRVALA